MGGVVFAVLIRYSVLLGKGESAPTRHEPGRATERPSSGEAARSADRG